MDMIHHSLLCREDLNEQRYAQSLLRAALKLRLIDHASLVKLQLLLRRQCQAYSGASRSLRTETAAALRDSMLFTLSMHIRSLDPVDALALLIHSPEDCFAEGRRATDALIQRTELLYRMELRKPVPIENDLLSSTLHGGISGFFKLYNPEYGANEIHITADYPALFFPSGWQGIEFISRYLECIILENRFLRLCNPAWLRSCIGRYAALNDTTPRDLCSNLFEIALACAGDFPIDSPELRRYVLRARAEDASGLARIRQLMT